MSEQIDYTAIKRRVENRIRARMAFFIHLTVFIIINLALWFGYKFVIAMVLQTMENSLPSIAVTAMQFPWVIIVTLGWGIGLLAHGIKVYFDSGAMDAYRERATQREIEREKMRLYGATPDQFQKPKRERAAGKVELSDDGELVYDDDLSQQASGKKQR